MKQPRKWYKLDNVATIMPSAAHGVNTRVFRIACELLEDVDGVVLQEALDRTIVSFPYLLSVLRKGLFWYYLDSRDIRPVVTEDALPACSPLYYPGRKNLLFRVTWYRKRINLEMFHALMDGTGGLVFLKALVTCYLSIRHGFRLPDAPDGTASQEDQAVDAYRHYYERQKGLRQLQAMASSRAYCLRGERDQDLLPHLIEGTVSASRFVKAAKENSASVGVFAVSVYIAAAMDEMSVRDRKRPIVVSVPIDLRRFFPSGTNRNFFGVINVFYRPKEYDGKFESIVTAVRESFAKQLSAGNVSQVMNSYEELEHNMAIKMVPLFFKDIATGFLNDLALKGETTTLSNLGTIEMPEETVPYISKFCPFMTAYSEQICVPTFGDNMVFGEVSAYTTHTIMLNFFRRLVALDIPVELASNDFEEA
jgi:NRPS condensation-like uncharacterized protein